MTDVATLQAEIDRLKAALARKSSNGLALKVSEKGAISLYGMGRFPVTMYAAQWERVLDNADKIRQFISDNEVSLSRKD